MVVDCGWGGDVGCELWKKKFYHLCFLCCRVVRLGFISSHCFMNKKHQLRRKDMRKTMWIDFVSKVIETNP